MHPSPDHKPPDPRVSTRMGARLDAETQQTVDDLARRSHTPRAAVLCHIMHWGLSRTLLEAIDQGEAQGPVRHLYLSVASTLYERVEKAATAAGVKTAPWLRHMVRQITLTDFPASWQAEPPGERSHDSRLYDTRFMLRLDPHTREKLEGLSTHFDTSIAEVIRQLIAQAEPKDFPKSWHMKAAERRARQLRR